MFEQPPAIQIVPQNKFDYKIFVLDLLSILSALAAGYSYRLFLDGTETPFLSSFNYLLVSAAVFFTLSALENVLVKSWRRRILAVFLESLSLLAAFYDYPFYLAAVSALLIFLFILWGEQEGQAEIKNNTSIRFLRIIKLQFKKMVTGFSLAAAVIYMAAASGNGALISRETFSGFFDASSGFTKYFYPGNDFNISMAEWARNFVVSQLRQRNDFQNLPPDQQQKAIENTTENFLKSLSEKLGVKINPEKSVKDNAYEVISSKMKELKENLGNSFIIFWTLIVFLFIRSFGFLFYWPVSWLAWLVYKFLLEMKIIEVKGEPSIREYVSFL